uniref:Elongin-A n=1 Tax=Spermophilus dauricus TaxID=99837 RepID=A0A8C9Q0K4_SPEDA
MASALQVVEKLQARLVANPDPKKLLKYLKKPSTLPITVDILAETGVGKTVNSFRKHEQVGSFARDLVAQWKKLVPVERNNEADEQDFEKSNSRKRPRAFILHRSYSPEHRQKKHRKLSECEQPHKVSHSHERRDERKRCHRVSPSYSSDPESSDYGYVQSPPSCASPRQLYTDHYRSPEEDHESTVSHQKPGKGHSNAFQDRLGVSQERHLGEPQGKGILNQNKEHRSCHKEKRPIDAKGSFHPQSRSEKLQLVGADSTRLRKVPTDALPVLPDLPLPTIQGNYRPLPSLELMPSFQPKRKAFSSPQEEEEAGFTGRRMNSKMQVYSGSKCAYLPKMMTLYQQCIRVLKNNIDSIFEVGRAPFSILEPVLERCTPDQLYRIEEYNHVLIEDTDQLWKVHCHQDFKEERPEEYESWREMYLRLQDAREQRLRVLTKNIQFAHANRPLAKMAFVNSVAKPPRDVRRRQEKFGTGGAAVPEKVKIKPAPYTTGSSHIPASSNSFNPSSEEPAYDGPSTRSAHLVPVVSSTISYDPRKPAVKKIAPMMAKTIKAFKNRFSRR